jgi:2-iminobutanoate/2-iminopropanoate deaminase
MTREQEKSGVIGKEAGLAEDRPSAQGHGFKREIRAGGAKSPFPDAVESQGFTFTGAVGGVDEEGRIVSPKIPDQTARALGNLETILAAGGQKMEDLVKCTVYLVDLRDAPAVEKIFQEVLRDSLPAISIVEVQGLPGGRKISIKAVAVCPHPPEGKDVIDFMG